MTPEESMFLVLADVMNSVEENHDYAIGTADGTVTLFRAISDDERAPCMELVYDDLNNKWAVRHV